jgi:hypothetical protein
VLLDLRPRFCSPVSADAIVLFDLDSHPRGFFLSLVHRFLLQLVLSFFAVGVAQKFPGFAGRRIPPVPISVTVHSWLDAGLARDSVKAAVFVSFFNPARAKSRSKVFVFWSLSSRCGCHWSVAVRRPARRFSRVGCTSSQFLVLIPADLCLIRSGLSSPVHRRSLSLACLSQSSRDWSALVSFSCCSNCFGLILSLLPVRSQLPH